jgi:hypothetical protein
MYNTSMWVAKYENVLLEVLRELNRTYDQLGGQATEEDYAADVIRRLSHLYRESNAD